MSREKVLAFIGLGSNLEDPTSQVTTAFADLGRMHASRLTARSALYRSKAIGPPGQPDYVNAVAALITELDPHVLLDELQAIEQRHGRKRTVRWGARTLDLDLLLFGDRQIATDRLTVPHPEMHHRAFVLVPLHEIAPTLRIPGLGSVADLVADLDCPDLVRLTSSGNS